MIVTTPQEVAVGDALRGAKMFERVGVPVAGVVENMGAYEDPETGKRIAFFSSGGGERSRRGAWRAAAGVDTAPAGSG